MRSINFIICISLAVSTDLFGQSTLTKTGTTVANYLNIDVGSRAIAMGGSFVSIAEGDNPRNIEAKLQGFVT